MLGGGREKEKIGGRKRKVVTHRWWGVIQRDGLSWWLCGVRQWFGAT